MRPMLRWRSVNPLKRAEAVAVAMDINRAELVERARRAGIDADMLNKGQVEARAEQHRAVPVAEVVLKIDHVIAIGAPVLDAAMVGEGDRSLARDRAVTIGRGGGRTGEKRRGERQGE